MKVLTMKDNYEVLTLRIEEEKKLDKRNNNKSSQPKQQRQGRMNPSTKGNFPH